MANTSSDRLVISYMQLRRYIGYLGMGLPFILVLGNYFIAGAVDLLNTLSTYYHSSARDLFVAVLAAIAVFAFSYRGYDARDNIAGDIAALSALGIAFFPTADGNPDLDVSSVIDVIHKTSAVIFFLTLAYFSLVLFPKTNPARPMTRQKRKRNKVYKISGYLILLSIILIAAYELYFQAKFINLQDYKPIFWLESLALIAFGFAWVTKGEAILSDT